MRARVARDELAERVRHGLEERGGQTLGRRAAERVAEAAGVLGRDEARLAGERARGIDPALPLELGQPLARARLRLALGPGVTRAASSSTREVAEPQQQVVQRVGPVRPVPRRAAGAASSRAASSVAVEELAQLRLAEQLAQLRRDRS